MKKILLFMVIIIFVASFSYAEVFNKTLLTTFSPGGQCYAGFSRKSVTSAAPLSATDKYMDNAEIKFNFDPVNSYYYTDLFYAYCQSFTSTPVTVKVSASKYIRNETDGVDLKDLGYELVAVEETATTGPWTAPSQTEGYRYQKTEKGTFSHPRVVMCQPISVRIPASVYIERNKTYTVTFTLEVISDGSK